MLVQASVSPIDVLIDARVAAATPHLEAVQALVLLDTDPTAHNLRAGHADLSLRGVDRSEAVDVSAVPVLARGIERGRCQRKPLAFMTVLEETARLHLLGGLWPFVVQPPGLQQLVNGRQEALVDAARIPGEFVDSTQD